MLTALKGSTRQPSRRSQAASDKMRKLVAVRRRRMRATVTQTSALPSTVTRAMTANSTPRRSGASSDRRPSSTPVVTLPTPLYPTADPFSSAATAAVTSIRRSFACRRPSPPVPLLPLSPSSHLPPSGAPAPLTTRIGARRQYTLAIYTIPTDRFDTSTRRAVHPPCARTIRNLRRTGDGGGRVCRRRLMITALIDNYLIKQLPNRSLNHDYYRVGIIFAAAESWLA